MKNLLIIAAVGLGVFVLLRFMSGGGGQPGRVFQDFDFDPTKALQNCEDIVESCQSRAVERAAANVKGIPFDRAIQLVESGQTCGEAKIDCKGGGKARRQLKKRRKKCEKDFRRCTEDVRKKGQKGALKTAGKGRLTEGHSKVEGMGGLGLSVGL